MANLTPTSILLLWQVDKQAWTAEGGSVTASPVLQGAEWFTLPDFVSYAGNDKFSLTIGGKSDQSVSGTFGTNEKNGHGNIGDGKFSGDITITDSGTLATDPQNFCPYIIFSKSNMILRNFYYLRVVRKP